MGWLQQATFDSTLKEWREELARPTLAKLRKILKSVSVHRDTESAHADADDALVDLLRRAGFDEVADEFEAVPKWYS